MRPRSARGRGSDLADGRVLYVLSVGSRLLHLLIDRTVTLVPHVGTSHCSPLFFFFFFLFSLSCFSTFAFGVVAVIAAAAFLPKAVQ